MASTRRDRIGEILGEDASSDKSRIAIAEELASQATPEKQLRNMITPYFADELRKQFQRPIKAQANSLDSAIHVAVTDAYWNGVEAVINFIADLGDS